MTNIKRPIIRIHDIETNEIIDTEMDDKEFAKYKANLKSDEQIEAEIATKQAEVQIKATAKAALLAKLGITAEEAALLLG